MKNTRKSRASSSSAKAAIPKRPSRKDGQWISNRQFDDLQDRLREAQETLEAIRSGGADAVVVSGENGSQIYTLSGAEQPYRVYVERMQEGAVTVSRDGVILYANQRFAEMLQTPLERVMGSPITTYIPEDAWSKVYHVFFRSETVVKNECILRRGGDAEHPVNLSASQLPLPDQTVMCLVITDLAGQKEKENFRLAKELAEKANASKDTFLAALSHELRTPLTPVLMVAATLELDKTLPASTRKALSMIRRNVELEARLIDDLLDLTRLTHGKMELHPSALDLHTLIHQAIETCKKHIDEKKHRLELHLDATRSQFTGDGVRLQQALWNLIRNAVKFTPRKGLISIRTANPAPDRLSVTVQDSGMGFEPSRAQLLFQAFEQGGQEITREFGGLGLGLVISRSIIEAHSGTIVGKSDGVGRGATFTFEVPMVLTGAQTDGDEYDAETTKSSPPKNILLVEDHADTRNSLELLLKRNNHQVMSASSVREALQLASQNTFDIVISDVGLPDGSGLDLMTQLHSKFGLSGIGLTGYGMEEDVEKSHAAGFVCHLTKPIRFEQLKSAIQAL